MDLVSNFAGSISPSIFGGNNIQSVSSDIDMDDNTFSDMLEKQIKEQNKENLFNNFIPSGINIAELDGTNPIYNTQKNINSVKNMEQLNNDIESINLYDFNNRKGFSTSEVLTFFNSLFENKPTLTDNSKSGLFEFERKLAAGSYNKYAKNIVTDLSEFVTDTIKMKS